MCWIGYSLNAGLDLTQLYKTSFHPLIYFNLVISQKDVDFQHISHILRMRHLKRETKYFQMV